MKNFEDLTKSRLTRRTFLQGMAAVGSATVVAGCSSDDGGGLVVNSGSGGTTTLPGAVAQEDLSNAKIFHAGCTHNCGTGVRCVSRLHVVNGVVKRVTTDESDYAFDGTYRDKEQYNDARSLTCPKGRAFKFRSHHPGRLRYALKQTKERGNMSGFIRIPVQQALDEIAKKYRAIHAKYGANAIHTIYGTSGGYDTVGTYANYASVSTALTSPAGARPYYADYSYHQYHYGQPLVGHPGVGNAYYKQCNVAWQYPAIHSVVRNVVSWGSNILSTNNAAAWGYIKSMEELRNRGGKAYFIGPELSDTGVTCHTDWVQVRNYTDTALVMAMMYHMIINTFNADGSLMANPMLDVDYLDTMVYGFFDSPEYWVHNTTGVIAMDNPSDANYTHVEAVPAGKSLSAYIMGNDNRLTKAQYSAGNNYTAQQFAAKQTTRNADTCKYESKVTNTKYLYKKAFNEPKTPAWASAITGTPVAQIEALAKMYCDPAQHPIFNEWCGGLQKQGNGVINIWAISSLMAVTKTFGLSGETFSGAWATTLAAGPKGNTEAGVDVATSVTSATGITPIRDNRIVTISTKEWFNGIKLAFKDDLKNSKKYDGKRIPDWDFENERYYFNDGGVKTGVLYERDADGNLIEDPANGNTYKVKMDGGKPVYVGTRMVINSGGGIMVNQHMNTNDSAEVYKALPLSGNPTDADTPCFVTMDVFMSPTARYMDYVLPCAVNLETVDTGVIGGPVSVLTGPILGSTGVTGAYRPPVVKTVGDVIDSFEMTYKAYKAHSTLDEYTDPLDSLTTATTTGIKGSHLKYIGNVASEADYKSVADIFDERVDKAIADVSSRFYRKTKDEVHASTFTPYKNQDAYVVQSTGNATQYETRGTSPSEASDATFGATYVDIAQRNDISNTGQIRKNFDAYMALDAATRRTTPFINTTDLSSGVKNTLNADTYFNKGSFGTPTGGGAQIADITNRPNPAGRMQVYSGMLVFDYENAFSKYHGWLPAEKRGQENVDAEGDPLVYPIPMYFNFEDFFNEAFGAFNATNPVNVDFVDGKGLTLGTTHNRYRVHSTHNENPFLRELNHRVKGGAPANDWGEYAVIPEGAAAPKGMISNAVEQNMEGIASWHEIWINTQDAADNGVKHGDLIEVYNPIGIVRVIAKVTDRCVRGHINLHQGGWYDPNPKDDVDDGGCANTLIASRPSRIDHGNAQQMCYVKIRKVQG